jgi:hypothetical protein
VAAVVVLVASATRPPRRRSPSPTSTWCRGWPAAGAGGRLAVHRETVRDGSASTFASVLGLPETPRDDEVHMTLTAVQRLIRMARVDPVIALRRSRFLCLT